MSDHIAPASPMPAGSPRPPRSALARAAGSVALAGLGIVMALGLAEVALRLAGITYPVFETPDATRGVALRPGKEGWYRKEGEALVRINAHGYRDSERQLAKPAGTFRIAVLGDSFVESRQVALEASFPVVMEKALAGCPALGGHAVEVLNFGVSGYATTEALLTLRQDALRFAPDLVLLALYPGNDIGENSKKVVQGAGAADWRMPKPIHTLDARGELVLEGGVQPTLLRRALYVGIHHSRLLEIVNEVRRIWEVRKLRQAASQAQDTFELGISKEVYAPPADDAWREAWQVTEGLLARVQREATAGQARFAVGVVTMAEQVHPQAAQRAAVQQRLGVPDLLYAERRIGEIGAKTGFAVVRLAEPLRAAAERDQVFLHGFKNTVMGFGHWNEAGHRVAGQTLARELCAGGLGARP
ncbi:MAG: hypothetical protein JNJ89_05500 [Rubrivivax sp.]|nr:hypothetical protein [Rubrivivax sp.]